MVPIEVENQLKVFERRALGTQKVKQIYEHIAYELRYEHLSSIEHGSICMKHNLSNHSYKVVCSH